MVMLAPPTEMKPMESAPVVTGLGEAPEAAPEATPEASSTSFSFPDPADPEAAPEQPAADQAAPEQPTAEQPVSEGPSSEPESTESSVASKTLASIKEKRDQVRSAKNYWEGCKEEVKDAKDSYEKLRDELDAMIDHGIKQTTAQVNKPEDATDEDESESIADPETDWASTPTSELNLLSVKGMGQKKVDEIEHEYPTIGELEELRASRGGLTSISGIGKNKASDIEQKILDWLSANRDAQVLAEAAAGGGEKTEQEAPAEDPPAEDPHTEDSSPEQQLEDEHEASKQLDGEQIDQVEGGEGESNEQASAGEGDLNEKPDWHYGIEQCNEILGQIDDIPEAGEEFAISASEGVRGIGEWIEKNEHITEKQQEALDSIQQGVQNWIG